MSTEWDNFVRDLNPKLLETERFGVPSASERPGGRAERKRQEEHQRRREDWHRLHRERLADFEIEQVTSEWLGRNPLPLYKPRPGYLSRAHHVLIAARIAAESRKSA
jgi:hypothetical protein